MSGNKESFSVSKVKNYLLSLQESICSTLEQTDGEAQFQPDEGQREPDQSGQGTLSGGGGQSRVLSDGAVFEQAGVNFSHVFGNSLPPSATAARAASRARSPAAATCCASPHTCGRRSCP